MNYKERIQLIKKIQEELESVVTTVPNPVNDDVDEAFDVMTNEGFVNQLNRLFTKGSIDNEYYIQQVGVLKNTYSNTYSTIKEKLIMDV